MADANQPLKPGDVVLHNGLKWTLIARVVVPEVPPQNADLPDTQQTGDLVSRFAVYVGGQNVSPPDAQGVAHGAALGRYPEAFAWCCCRLKHKMERLMVGDVFFDVIAEAELEREQTPTTPATVEHIRAALAQ